MTKKRRGEGLYIIFLFDLSFTVLPDLITVSACPCNCYRVSHELLPRSTSLIISGSARKVKLSIISSPRSCHSCPLQPGYLQFSGSARSSCMPLIWKVRRMKSRNCCLLHVVRSRGTRPRKLFQSIQEIFIVEYFWFIFFERSKVDFS